MEKGVHAYLRAAVVIYDDEVRRAGRWLLLDEITMALLTADLSPLEHAIGQEALGRYERALAQLAYVEREAAIARIELGFSDEEVAAPSASRAPARREWPFRARSTSWRA